MAIIVPKYESTRQPAARIGSPLSLPQLEGPRMVGEAARQFEEITEKLKRARQTTALSNAQTDLFKTLVELENDFQNRTDFQNFEPEFKKRVKNLQDHYQTTIQDPEVLEAFRPDFERMTTRSLVNVRSMARHQEIDKGRADFNRNQETYFDIITSNQDPEKRFEALNLAKLSVAGNVSAGYISREQGEKQLETLNYAAVKTNAWRTAKSLGFEEGIAWLENEENAQGLDLKDRQAIVNNLQAEQTEEREAGKRAYNDLHREVINKVSEYIRDGKYAIARIAVENAEIDEKDKLTLDKAIDSAISAKTAGQKDPFNVSSVSYVSDLLDKALNGELDPDSIIPIAWKLSRQDANVVRETAKRALEGEETFESELKKGAVYKIRNQILKGNQLMGFTPESISDANLAEMEFLQMWHNETDREKRMNMANPASKDYVVDKIVKPYLKPLNVQIEEMTQRIENMFNEEMGRKTGPPKKKKVQKREGNETIEEYLKRTGQE
jgi:hypothetical protein